MGLSGRTTARLLTSPYPATEILGESWFLGFRDSKHMTSSNHSSNPSLRRTSVTWPSFAFEKICGENIINEFSYKV